MTNSVLPSATCSPSETFEVDGTFRAVLLQTEPIFLIGQRTMASPGYAACSFNKDHYYSCHTIRPGSTNYRRRSHFSRIVVILITM